MIRLRYDNKRRNIYLNILLTLLFAKDNEIIDSFICQLYIQSNQILLSNLIKICFEKYLVLVILFIYFFV